MGSDCLLAILIFEFVEVLAIGSPPGIARNLQVFYVILGTLFCLQAGGLWWSSPHMEMQSEL